MTTIIYLKDDKHHYLAADYGNRINNSATLYRGSKIYTYPDMVVSFCGDANL